MTSLIFLSILILVVIVTGSESSHISDAKLDRLLKKLNKPALKSIKSPDGDIIDCVHIKNHPIYDHPLFKNHTIQMRPSSYPEGWNNESLDTKKSSMVSQLWTINGKCPKNSIPIRRTRREDILRAESIERYGKKDPNSFPHAKQTNPSNDNVTREYALVTVKVDSPRAKFHGVQSVINVWKPYVQAPKEFSLAQIWVVAGRYRTQLNTIEAGWQVYQDLYDDANPRYFIYWTNDGYNTTGCYNLNCPGFVPINQEFALGAAISHVSTLDGQQEVFAFSIWKDRRTGNWWLKFNNHQIIGYWPASLFSRLQDGATEIQWGGEITDFRDGSRHTTTKMGSGHFAEQGWRKASYFRNLEILNESEIRKQPENLTQYMTAPNCYNIRNSIDQNWGTYFYYGGPGRNPNCN